MADTKKKEVAKPATPVRQAVAPNPNPSNADAAAAPAETPEEAQRLKAEFETRSALAPQGAEATGEPRTGTGATIPGMKSVAGESPSQHPVIYGGLEAKK